MSDLSPNNFIGSRPLDGFRPWFAHSIEPAGVSAPATKISDEAYADGFSAGRREAEHAFSEERVRYRQLVAAAECMRAEPTDELSRLIASAVEMLVRQTVGETEVDRDLLVSRAKRAAAVIGEASAPGVLYVHPEDLRLLHGAELGLTVAIDDNLTRGSLRIESACGSVEDGIATHLATLSEQIGLKDGER